MLVTNETLAPLYLRLVFATCLSRRALKSTVAILPDGEQYKKPDGAGYRLYRIAAKPHGRDTTLLAPGGGVVGDLTGLCGRKLSTWRPFYSNPDHVAVLVDSLSVAKRQSTIRSAKHDWRVLPARIGGGGSDCLKTLPDARAGFGSGGSDQIRHYSDGEFFNWLEENMDALLPG